MYFSHVSYFEHWPCFLLLPLSKQASLSGFRYASRLCSFENSKSCWLRDPKFFMAIARLVSVQICFVLLCP